MKLSAKRIEKNLKNITVTAFNRVTSTNTVAKKLAENGANEGAVVTAATQTDGRGRLGRSFLSKKGGVYFSLVLKPKAAEAPLFITVAAAVAAARAIETVTPEKCDIKWVNDVYINGKKVCGILTEGAFAKSGMIDYAILGVGINLFEPKGGFSEKLPLAGSVFCKKDAVFFKNRVKERVITVFLKNFFELYEKLEQKEYINEYRQRSFLIGKEISYIKDGVEHRATVKDIDNDARLVVCVGEKTDVLSHGEIQIIGMEQFAV